MSRTTKLAAIAAASATAAALAASPALASGPWSVGSLSASSSGLSIKVNGNPTATCTGSSLGGQVTAIYNSGSDADFYISSASASGCGVTVTPTNFNWSGSFSGSAVSMYFAMKALGCTYSGTLSGGISGYTATFTDQPVSGTGLFCVSGVTVSATYVFSQP